MLLGNKQKLFNHLCSGQFVMMFSSKACTMEPNKAKVVGERRKQSLSFGMS